MSTVLEQLRKRFEEAKLQVKPFVRERQKEDGNGDVIKSERQYLMVSIPEERDSKNIIIVDDEDIGQVKASQIEKFRFIKGYEAAWSNELEVVECEIEGQNSLFLPIRSTFRRLRNYLKSVGQNFTGDEDSFSFEFPAPKENIKIIIGYSSLDFAILQSFQREAFFLSGRIRRKMTIRIEGQPLKSHEEAIDFLIKISNAVLFQIDLVTDIAIHLVADRQIMRNIKQRKIIEDKASFLAPKYEYNKEPLALY